MSKRFLLGFILLVGSLHLLHAQEFQYSDTAFHPGKSIHRLHVRYDLDKASLKPESQACLDSLVAFLKQHPQISGEIGNHRDNRNPQQQMKRSTNLTQARARAVVDYLVSKGIDPGRLTAKGYGATKLKISDKEIAMMQTKEEMEAAHAINRRTEFKVLSTNYGNKQPDTLDREVLMGGYVGKNIFIQNPNAEKGPGLCVQGVLVNGIAVSFHHESAFEIKLDSLGLQKGERVKVEIIHLPGCMPKVLNPGECCPEETYTLLSIKVNDHALLEWSTRDEGDRCPFVIEQFRWNRWIKVGEIPGNGGVGENKYAFQLTPNSGVNQVRINHKPGSLFGLSPAVKFNTSIPKVNATDHPMEGKVVFNTESSYELYDQYGNLVLKGYGDVVDYNKCPKGLYFLNFDNSTMSEIHKR